MKQKNDNNKKEIVVRFGLVISMVLFLAIMFIFFVKLIEKDKYINLSGENYYQYFLGIKEEYSGKINIFEKDDNTQLILEDGRTVYADSTPMYYKDVLGKSLFLKEMELVQIDKKIYKLDAFTNVLLQNNQISIKKVNREKSTTVENAFIFDGEDLYFFLEETEVNIGDRSFILSPLSYVKVNYRTSVEIYDYEKDQYTMIEDEKEIQHDAIAINKYHNYKINMSLDSLSTEKMEQLLISNIKKLDSFFENK